VKDESPYAMARRVLASLSVATPAEMDAALQPYTLAEPYVSQIVAEWRRTIIGRHLARGPRPAPDLGEERSEARAALRRGIARTFAKFRLPDGRLFSTEVPYYEYEELKRTYAGLAGFISWCQGYARVNDDTLTASDFIKPADAEASAKAFGLLA